jgi:hypothetical protein
MQIKEITKRLKVYLITSILSITLTLVGFSYNVYRLEQNELNNTIRVSSFEILKELASLEQIIYASYYEQDKVLGNPRVGWVKVGIIKDLSYICFQEESNASKNLYLSWQKNWNTIDKEEKSVNNLIKSIDQLREEVRKKLQLLH